MAVVIALLSCVPHVEIVGAPCPCPDVYSCCEFLASCVNSKEACQETLPPSSGIPCTRDSDCPSDEICHAWSNSSGLAGPQTCQRDCSIGFPCASPETCRLVSRDGSLVDDLDLTHACTTVHLIQGCEKTGCENCDVSRIGQTFCQDKAIHVCFLGVHGVCGLICSSVAVQTCGDAGCMDSGGSTCNANPSGDPCVDYSCSACPNPSAPESYSCDGTRRVVGCAVARLAGGTCDKICVGVALDCPGTSVCVDDGEAHCAP